MMKTFVLTILGFALLSISCPAQTARTNTPAYIVVGGGMDGVLDSRKTLIGMVEFQPAWHKGPLGTWVSFHASDRDYYLGAGLLLDWYITDHWFITPSFGAGAYEEHNGIDLGSRLEFRSGMECGYDMKETGRISVGFWHLSNGGLGDRNPGTELVAVRYAFPLRF